MLMTVHFTCVDSVFLFTSKFSSEAVAMDTSLEVSAIYKLPSYASVTLLAYFLLSTAVLTAFLSLS